MLAVYIVLFVVVVFFTLLALSKLKEYQKVIKEDEDEMTQELGI